MIPLSGQHGEPATEAEPRNWPFAGKEYLLCPANLSRHKNHEVLMAGAASHAARHPIVLTGEGTDLRVKAEKRVQAIRAAADAAGLIAGDSLHAVGYVDDASYYRILDGAWALVMPTLAEGGGSFPVLEAMERGIPAVASDIPVMREMVERAGGEVLWFDPYDPASLERSIAELERDYSRYRTRAVAQARTLRTRTWKDVASDYARLMGSSGRGGRTDIVSTMPLSRDSSSSGGWRPGWSSRWRRSSRTCAPPARRRGFIRTRSRRRPRGNGRCTRP